MKPTLVQGKRTVLWVAIGLLGLVLTAGCSSERKTTDATGDAREETLTAETAKACLLELDLGQIPSGVIVPGPKEEPIAVVNADEIAVGIWKCNLRQKTFDATAEYPNASRHRFNHVTGVFEHGTDGKWVAKITKGESAD
jgi:hypothetical protein